MLPYPKPGSWFGPRIQPSPDPGNADGRPHTHRRGSRRRARRRGPCRRRARCDLGCPSAWASNRENAATLPLMPSRRMSLRSMGRFLRGGSGTRADFHLRGFTISDLTGGGGVWFAGARQAERTQYNTATAERHRKPGPHRCQPPERGQRQQDQVVPKRPDEVAPHDDARFAGEPQRAHDGAEIAAEDRDTGGFAGGVGPGCERDSEVRAGERRGRR